MNSTLEPMTLTGTVAGSVRARRSARRVTAVEELVIVGAGMAGYKLCERLISAGAGARYRITVCGEEPRAPYDRVHLTSYLHDRSPDRLLLAPASWYARHSIATQFGDAVVAVDRERKIVRSASGREQKYDRLIFATGSRPFVPPIPGNDLAGVFVYRTIEDLTAILNCAHRSRRAAVLGGGLLGVEVAKALQDLGLETWVVERGSSLLARQLDPEAGAMLKAHVERLGIRVCAQRETQAIEALGEDRLLQFNTGECLRVQLVVMTVGIRPRDELAARCGLQIGPRGGVLVNDSLQSSDPAIYAIGECASHRGTCYGLAAPAYKMADLLAERLLGKRRKFTGSDQSTRLKLSGIEVATLGDFQAAGETVAWREGNSCRRLIVENNRVVGATAIGEWPEAVRIQELTERQARLWRWRRERFARTGRLWKGSVALHVSQWPEAALVCNCMGVRRGALSAACANGGSTVEHLAEHTGASTVCGSCKPLLAEMVGAPAWLNNVPGLRTLAWACLAACVLAPAILLLTPVPIPDSVQLRLHSFDVLWREAFWKQVTGFTLVGLMLIGLGLSLRKRVKRFSLGAFGHWRALHAVLGVITLLALVTHTGMRLGQNLNLVLSLNLLVLALVGGLAGLVTATERRLNPAAAKRLRSTWNAAHLALAWPLPVLVVFHVLIAYYF